jgi:hypothetical protein
MARKRKVEAEQPTDIGEVENKKRKLREDKTEGHVSSSMFPFKHIYHLAHKSNLDSIKKYGLLSTAQLVETTGLSEKEKKQIVTQHRPKSVILPDNLVIRDQSPMPPTVLSKTLPAGTTPSDWYQLMNSFVFFWPDRERVERHRNAHGYGGSDEEKLSLLVFDAEKIARDYGDKLFLSPINSGFAMRKAANRSERSTFVPFQEWSQTSWPREEDGKQRPRSAVPVEIAIKNRFPLEPYLLRIE